MAAIKKFFEFTKKKICSVSNIKWIPGFTDITWSYELCGFTVVFEAQVIREKGAPVWHFLNWWSMGGGQAMVDDAIPKLVILGFYMKAGWANCGEQTSKYLPSMAPALAPVPRILLCFESLCWHLLMMNDNVECKSIHFPCQPASYSWCLVAAVETLR